MPIGDDLYGDQLYADAKAGVIYVEDLVAIAAAAVTVQDRQQFMEVLLINLAAQSSITAADGLIANLIIAAQAEVIDNQIINGVLQLANTITSITQVSEQQLFLENLRIMALSHASVADIQKYIEQAQASATSAASLKETLFAKFLGVHIMGTTVRARVFMTTVRARVFMTTVRARA